MSDQIDAPLQPNQEENKDKQDPSDNLTPEHPRFKQVIAENHDLKESVDMFKVELEELKTSIAKRQEKPGEEEEWTDDERAAYAKITRGLKKDGYITKNEYDEDQRVNRTAAAYEKLSGKYDGKNGYPKFVPVDVQKYAQEHGIGNLEAAYKEMHWQAIVQVEAKKLNEGPTPPTSEKPGNAEHKIAGTEKTREDIAIMSDEEWAKNEEKIMKNFKASLK